MRRAQVFARKRSCVGLRAGDDHSAKSSCEFLNHHHSLEHFALLLRKREAKGGAFFSAL